MKKKIVCKECGGTGVVIKVEWTEVDGRDMDYEVKIRCVCQDE